MVLEPPRPAARVAAISLLAVGAGLASAPLLSIAVSRLSSPFLQDAPRKMHLAAFLRRAGSPVCRTPPDGVARSPWVDERAVLIRARILIVGGAGVFAHRPARGVRGRPDVRGLMASTCRARAAGQGVGRSGFRGNSCSAAEYEAPYLGEVPRRCGLRDGKSTDTGRLSGSGECHGSWE